MSESNAVARSSRRSRDEVLRLVQEYEASGLTRQAYCRERGISVSMLDYFRRRHSDISPKLPVLSPVELIGPVSLRGSCMRVELANGRRVLVEPDFDATLLRRLVTALEG